MTVSSRGLVLVTIRDFMQEVVLKMILQHEVEKVFNLTPISLVNIQESGYSHGHLLTKSGLLFRLN